MALAVARDLHPQGFTVEILEGRDAFCALEKEWNQALAKGPRDEPMLRHEWLRAWIENFAPGQPLRVFVARSGRELCAAVPLIETKERSADTCFFPMTTWALPCNDHSQRGGVLLGARGLEALQAIWDKLVDTTGWDRLRLRELPEGCGEWKFRDIAERAGYPCGLYVSLRSPYLPLPLKAAPIAQAKPAAEAKPAGDATPANAKQKQKGGKAAQLPTANFLYEQVEAALDSKFRSNLRRRKRRLAEQGEVKYVLVDGKDAKAFDIAMADFFEIEGSGWKGKGGTAIAQKPELVGFYTQIARDAAKRGALALGFLELNGKRIAAHLTLVQAGRSFLLKLGYDEAFGEFSPGQQLVSEAIRDACQRNLREFDFLGPWMEWKADWETRFRPHTWLTIFRPTRKGLLIHEARFTGWPVARAVIGQAKKVMKDLGARFKPSGATKASSAPLGASTSQPPTPTPDSNSKEH